MPEIRELQQQIDALRKELETLKADFKTLQAEVCWDIDIDDDDHFGMAWEEPEDDEQYEDWLDWCEKQEAEQDDDNGPAEGPEPIQIPF